MSVTIKEVSSPKELKAFIRFNYELYKGNPYFVPDLYDDMVCTFNPKKNPAFEFCEATYFMALRDGKMVGRVAAIINHRANDTWQKKDVRFGWIDFIDDAEVADALIAAVENWGKAKGMDTIQGPLGFTDMDAEGMLVEGFDQLGTMATIYNYPYYPQHMERMGFEKDADWVEFKIFVPTEVPEKMRRISDLISRKYNLHVRKLKNMKEVRQGGYGQRIFELINESYAPLYGFSKMTEAQIKQYVDMYLPILDLRMITLVEDDNNELIAVGISMASLSRALQKSKGKMWPFGWFHLAKALFLKHPSTLDLLLVGVKPEFQSRGVNALIFNDLITTYNKLGYTQAESNPELETNNKVQAQWEYFETIQHKRRRAFKKAIK